MQATAFIISQQAAPVPAPCACADGAAVADHGSFPQSSTDRGLAELGSVSKQDQIHNTMVFFRSCTSVLCSLQQLDPAVAWVSCQQCLADLPHQGLGEVQPCTLKPQPVSSFPLPCALTRLRRSVALNLEEGTKQRKREGYLSMFWPKNRLLGWLGHEDETTGLLTLINAGLNVRIACCSPGQGVVQDTGCFLLSLSSPAGHYCGERKHYPALHGSVWVLM